MEKKTDMNQHDLLIELSTRQGIMQKQIDQILKKLDSLAENRHCATHEEKIRQIELSTANLKCSTHAEKIKTLERIVWAALLLGIGSFIKTMWDIIASFKAISV